MTDRRMIHERAMPIELRREGDGLTVDGYATTFDDPYPVTDQLGTYMESFARGAFKKTLREHTFPKMQFDHGGDPLFGNLTIGKWQTVEETDEGLHVVGRLHDTWHTEPIRAAIDEGSLTSMSIRFSAVKQDPEEFGPDDDERTILEARLYEMGPVVFPANESTSVLLRALSSHLSPEQRASLIGNQTEPAASTDTDAANLTPVGAGEHLESQPSSSTGITVQQRKLWTLKRSHRRDDNGTTGDARRPTR